MATEIMGWAAAALTLLAFTARDLHRLRLASVGASVCFITFAAGSGAWPVLALHALLLPLNVWRLFELWRGQRRADVIASAATAAAAGNPQPGPAPRRHSPASWRYLGVLALLLVPGAMPMAASATPPPPYGERLHHLAVDAFRQGRFPEAYGRFIKLANLGHPASARYALWMCDHGLALFGRDWDCGPDEVRDWAQTAAQPPARAAVRGTLKPTAATPHARR